MFHLLECALLRCLVRPPAHDFRAVPESAADEMIVRNFEDYFWIDGAHSPLRVVLQRLGPPSALPVNPRLE